MHTGARMLLIAVLASALGCGGPLYDEDAHDELLAALGDTSFTVFPIVLTTQTQAFDHEHTGPLVDFFVDRSLGTVTLDQTEVPLATTWQSNQAAMWRDSMDNYLAFLEGHRFGTAYAVQTECLFLGGNGGVGGVHVYIADDQRRAAGGLFTNEHSDEFEEHQPTDIPGCVDVAVDALIEQLIERD